MALKIEPVTRNHNRTAFDCGNYDLNQYLRNIARQHIEKGISRTFILVEDSNSSYPRMPRYHFIHYARFDTRFLTRDPAGAESQYLL